MKVVNYVKILLGVLVIFILLTCTEDDDVLEPPPHEVWIEEKVFFPDSIVVDEGTTITWVNKDKISHTVTEINGAFDSGLIGPDETFQYTFDELGAFEYTCTVHSDMRGRVVVIF